MKPHQTTAPTRIIADIVKVSDLNRKKIKNMFELMSRYYNNLTWENFIRDLKDKDDLVLIQDTHQGKDEVGGFSTLKAVDITVEGEYITGIFSGDTIIDTNCRGGVVSQVQFLKYLFAAKKRAVTGRKVYWILISKGYRTYRLIRSYFNRSYPNAFEHTPVFEKKLIDAFGGATFPEYYSPKKSIIYSGKSKDYLKDADIEITDGKLKNPDIAYFVKKNPGYMKGDELVCVAEVHLKNLSRSGYWLVKRFPQIIGANVA